MAVKTARKWNPSLHPRDARGRFTRSSTRVMKGTDTKRARSALAGFAPAKIGSEADGRAWTERNAGRKPAADSAMGRYLAGEWRQTNPAIRAQKTPPPGVDEIDAEFSGLAEDVVLRRQVPLQMFAHIPVGDLVGMKVRDAAYASTSLDRPDAGPSAPDAVTMHIAAAAGTPAYVNAADNEVLLARDTEIAITRAEPNGRGGWDLYGAVIPKTAVKREQRAATEPTPAPAGDGSEDAAAPTAAAASGTPTAGRRGGGRGGRGSRASRPAKRTPAPAPADTSPASDDDTSSSGGTDQQTGDETPAAGPATPASGPDFDTRIGRAAKGERVIRDTPVRLPDLADDPDVEFGEHDPDDVAEALETYKGNDHQDINHALRNGTLDRGDYAGNNWRETVDRIDAAMAESALAEDAELWRGILHPQGVFGDAWGPDMTGTEFTDAAYTSASVSENAARNFAHAWSDHAEGASNRVVMRMLAPAGTKAVNISSIDWEGEMLLQRGLRFRVARDNGVQNNVRQLDVEVIDPARPPVALPDTDDDRARDLGRMFGQTPQGIEIITPPTNSTGPLAALDPLDRERVRVAVENEAARIYASPMVGGSKAEAVRYVADMTDLDKLSTQYGRPAVWAAVEQVLTDHPELMTRTPQESDRAAVERTNRVESMASDAADLMKAGDYDGALALLDQAERLAPDHRVKGARSWDTLRGIVRRRAEQNPPAAPDAPATPSPAAPDGDAPDVDTPATAPAGRDDVDLVDAGEDGPWIAPATGALAELAPIDRERVRIAVEDNAGRVFRTPFMGGSRGNVARYVAEGRDLRDVSSRYGFRATVNAVGQILDDRPDLMDRSDRDIAAAVDDRAGETAIVINSIDKALTGGDFPAARAEIRRGEAIDPDYAMVNPGGPSLGWDAIRRLVDGAEADATAGREDETSDAPPAQGTGDVTPAAGTSAPAAPGTEGERFEREFLAGLTDEQLRSRVRRYSGSGLVIDPAKAAAAQAELDRRAADAAAVPVDARPEPRNELERQARGMTDDQLRAVLGRQLSPEVHAAARDELRHRGLGQDDGGTPNPPGAGSIDTPPATDAPGAPAGAADEPPAPDGLPEDRAQAYERGWAASKSGDPDALEDADEREEVDDFYRGYDDHAEGRGKWTSMPRPARPAAPRRAWEESELKTIAPVRLAGYRDDAERAGDTEGVQLIDTELKRRETDGWNPFDGMTDQRLRVEMSGLSTRSPRYKDIRAELDRRAAARRAASNETGRAALAGQLDGQTGDETPAAGTAVPTGSVTPRQAQDAAAKLGDVETERIVGPGGLSGATPEQLADLVAAADALPDDRPDNDGGTGGIPRPTGPDTGPAGPVQQADIFGGATDFVPASRSAIGLADRPNLGRERAIAQVQQLGMFDISDQKQMDGQMAMLDALLAMPEPDTSIPDPPSRAPEPAPAAPDVPASIVPEDLSDWSDEDLAELFRTVTGVHDSDDVDEDGAARIFVEWERREQAMADLVASVPEDLTGLPEGEVMDLYARLSSELGTMDHDVVARIGAELDRRQEAERLAEENAPKRALLARPVSELTDDEIALAHEYAVDLDDVAAVDRVVLEWDRRDREKEAAEQRERLEREAREAAEREAALQAAQEAERRAAAEHAAAQRDRVLDALVTAQEASLVTAYSSADVNTAVGSLGEAGLRGVFGDQMVDGWLAGLPADAPDMARNGMLIAEVAKLPRRDQVRVVHAAGDQAADEEFRGRSNNLLQTFVNESVVSGWAGEVDAKTAEKRALGRRAARELTRRKIQKLRKDSQWELQRWQAEAMSVSPERLSTAVLELAPLLVTAGGGEPDEINARLDALRAETTRRRAEAARLAEAKAAGPGAPARYRDTMAAYGRLRQMLQGHMVSRSDIRAQERLRLALAAVYGLPETATDKDIRAAERNDPRPLVDRAALVTAWFRHLARYDRDDTLDDESPDYHRGRPDDPDVPDTPDPAPPANISKADEVWEAILTNARQEVTEGRFDTAVRAARAIARTYRIPADDIDPSVEGLQALQGRYQTAMRYDDRHLRDRAKDFIANFRALASEDGVDPSDTLRHGPPDKGNRRASRGLSRESTPEQERRIDALVAKGWDWLEAYAEVHGLDADALRNEGRRSAGGRSGMTEKQIREAYGEWLEQHYSAADAATRGYLLKRTSVGKVDARTLFSGPWKTARAHASEELLRWWADNPRLTYADFKAQLVGGDAARASRERLISAGKENEFV